MRHVLLFIAGLFAAAGALAQSSSVKMKPLFEAVQKAGVDSELRGDIADRLGFGEHPLAIKDLVITKDGVQHAVNAFSVAGTPYLLFDSHLYAPEVYLFVRDMEGALISGIHGQQYQPITETIKMAPTDGVLVVGAEEAFWLHWLADGAKTPAN